VNKLLVLLVGVFTANLLANEYVPDWYPKKHTTSVVAYGDSETLEGAKKIAFDKIKEKIYKSGKLDNFSHMIMDDLIIEKQEIFENRFYLKAKYENSSLLEQLIKTIKKETFKTDEENNQYLLGSKLMNELNATFGYNPDVIIDGKVLRFKEHEFIIKNNEFKLFLSKVNYEDILLDVKDKLADKEQYFIKLGTKIDGFITLLQIADNGNVEILFANKKLELDKDIIFPNFKLSDGLQVILDENIEQKDVLTMAVLCEEQKDFSDFNNMFFSLTTKNYMLGNLINEIDGCKYTSVLTTVEKEKVEEAKTEQETQTTTQETIEVEEIQDIE
jgi:hypothetical protein